MRKDARQPPPLSAVEVTFAREQSIAKQGSRELPEGPTLDIRVRVGHQDVVSDAWVGDDDQVTPADPDPTDWTALVPHPLKCAKSSKAKLQAVSNNRPARQGRNVSIGPDVSHLLDPSPVMRDIGSPRLLDCIDLALGGQLLRALARE
jgi:hypothetical protein